MCDIFTCCMLLPQLQWSVYVCGEESWRLRVSEDSEQLCLDRAEGSEVRLAGNRDPLLHHWQS